MAFALNFFFFFWGGILFFFKGGAVGQIIYSEYIFCSLVTRDFIKADKGKGAYSCSLSSDTTGSFGNDVSFPIKFTDSVCAGKMHGSLRVYYCCMGAVSENLKVWGTGTNQTSAGYRDQPDLGRVLGPTRPRQGTGTNQTSVGYRDQPDLGRVQGPTRPRRGTGTNQTSVGYWDQPDFGRVQGPTRPR